jgi:glycosyltransferase involved in cell wall biosynthesis
MAAQHRHPRISICLPNLNTRPFLEERMSTILAQTFTEWELIVSDNFSDDGSWEFFQQFKGDPRISLFQAPRKGMYANWNECLRRVRGEYVYIATSDDTASPTCLERLSGALDACSNVDIAICRYETINEAGLPVVPQPINVDSFYGKWASIPHLRSGLLEFFVHVGLYAPSWGTMTAVLFRNRLLEKTGLFRTDCGSWADWFWAIRTSLFTDTIFIPEVLATWRRHSRQATQPFTTINVTKLNYTLLRDAVLECHSLLPKSVTDDPQWATALLRNCRGEYLMKLGLDRSTILKEPMVTLKGMAYASIHEPRYLLARLLTALSWNQDFFGHEDEYLRGLIQKMQVPWPPVPLVV